ncbi:cytochrome c6 PetJ [Sphaerothrix gracilis]|uniref:cytochrome c6 PetJ n=1 Tax=Sphaerothrix gracilis TaxID=3151835 RepID=UPI0031FC57C5
MKRVLWFCLAIASSLWLFVAPAAADIAEGARVFSANCAACHMGGGNVVNAAKTLKQSDLDQYEMASLDAITYQVTNGKNAMPAFKGRLTADQIASVAEYVLDQAEKGW